jgi:BirA family transcriptional regulator, biotin operon repressor / biotin---[acetyl-CoA-carboxylase] ligase
MPPHHAERKSTTSAMRNTIDNPWPGAVVVRKETTLSTMDDAMDLALAGCASGSVVCAGFQTSGRGRVPGRKWISAPGESLLATVVVLKRDFPGPIHELPLRAGVAVARAVEDAAGVSLRIKWPNDLMAEDRKLAGLLCEARGDILLVGIGVNLLQASFPPEIENTACSLRQWTGQAVEASRLLSLVLARLRESLQDDEWRALLLERLYRKGEGVRVELLGSQSIVEGTIDGVDERGRLVLRTGDGARVLIEQGEIARGL